MPYGTINTDKLVGSSGGTISPDSGVFRNRIINGAMVIDQRNAGASVTPSVTGSYKYNSVDRIANLISQASKFSMQQSSTAPTGFINSLLITSASAYSVGAGDYFVIAQPIEGLNVSDLAWGSASAATVTLSFWVRSSLTGSFGGALQNSAEDRSYPFTYTISAANTWEQKTLTIAGDQSGTWLTTNGIGIRIILSLGCGSTYGNGTAGAWAAGQKFQPTGATSVVGTNGATFYITSVQLEKGSTATSFDYRPYGTELALCQRYYFALNTANVGSNGSYFTGVNRGTSLQGHISPPQPMRTAPSLTSSGTTTFFVQNGSSNLNCTTAATIGSTTGGNQTIYLVSGTYSSYTAGYAGQMIDQSGASFLNFSAEL
jgi:hypothetical protein